MSLFLGPTASFTKDPKKEEDPAPGDPCPQCKKNFLHYGYGFAFGPGCGAYEVCDWCGYTHKTEDLE